MWGFEDPRVVWLEELGCFAITCTAYGPAGPAVHLVDDDRLRARSSGAASSSAPEDKNAALLPERVDGEWILFHRPTTAFGGTWHGEIVLSRSADLVSWSAAGAVLQPRAGAWWDSLRIGIGPPLLQTEHGWLLIYHGVKETVAGGIYRVGLALLDLRRPDARAAAAARTGCSGRCADYERSGDVPNALFPCGLVHDQATRRRPRSTTAPPTRRSASRRRSSTTCSRPC